MKRNFFLLFLTIIVPSTFATANDNWTPTSLPEKSFILLQYNKSRLYACDSGGCKRIKLPFKSGIVAQNFKNSYRVFNGFGINVQKQIQKVVWKWNPAQGTTKKHKVTAGNRKWPEYSINATSILSNGTVIGEFMVNDRRNMGYALRPGQKERPLAQFWRHRGSQHYIFRPDGSYLAIDAPGTMKEPTAPFSNQVKGYPHVLYQGKSLFGKARRLSSRPAYLSINFLNNYRHVSYWKLGRYKGEFKKGDWRKLLVEILDTKTGQTRVVGEYQDNLGPPDYKDTPRIVNFRHYPYLMHEYKPAQISFPGMRQYFMFYNLKTGKKKSIIFKNGYNLIGTFNLNVTLYSQSTFSDAVILGKREGTTVHLKVVRMPDQEMLMQSSLENIDASSIDSGSLFYNLIQADFIVK